MSHQKRSKVLHDSEKYSWSLNCLLLGVAVLLLGNNQKSKNIRRAGAYSRSLKCLLLNIAIILSETNLIHAQQMGLLKSISPSVVPFQGNTVIYAIGEGFQSVASPKCQIQVKNGVLGIEDNVVVNDNLLQCTMPPISPSYKQSIIDDAYVVQFYLIGGINGTIQMRFFDLDSISVHSISPNWTYIEESIGVTVHGSGFVETYESTCHSTVFDVKAFFVNTTELTCVFPTSEQTIAIDIDVYSVGQPSSIITEIGPTQFIYFATPPQVLHLRFNPSYAFLILQFDREVEVGGENDFNTTAEPSCGVIFMLPILFGLSSPKCRWHNTQQRQVIVELNDKSTVLPNMSIPLQNGIIRTRYVAYSKHTSGNVTVEANEKVLYPIPVIEGPQKIPYCGNLTLSGVKSYNSGPKALLYLWKVDIIEAAADSSASGEDSNSHSIFTEIYAGEIQEYLADEFNSNPTLSLPSDLFSVDTEYRVSLTVKNFLGYMGQREILLRKHELPVPMVWIVGSSHQLINPGEGFHVEGVTSIPDCEKENLAISYKWVLVNNGINIDLDDVHTNNLEIEFESHFLRHNTTYTLLFSATHDGMTSSATITIRTTSFSIRAVIFGGSTVAYGKYDEIILDASGSFGLTQELTDDPLFTVSWKCNNERDDVFCFNSNKNIELNITDGLVSVIPSNVLLTDTYRITVELLYDGILLSSSFQIIYIYNDTSGLSVFIEEPSRSDRIDVHSNLVLRGFVKSDSPGKVWWSSVYKPGYAYLPLDHVNISTPTSLSVMSGTALNQSSETYQILFTSDISTAPFVNPVSLTIPSGSLLPNNKYCFRLTTRNVYNKLKFSETEIKTDTLPSSGKISIFPSNGTSLQTSFTIEALQWTDNEEDFPLNYRMGFTHYRTNETTIVWLTSLINSNKLITVLPVVSATGLITVVLEIWDSYGASNRISEDLSVYYPVSESVNLETFYNGLRDQLINKGTLSQPISELVAVLYSFNYNSLSHSASLSIAEFKLLMIDVLVNLHQKNRFLPSESLNEVLLWIIQSLTTDVRIPNSRLPSLLDLIEDITQYQSLHFLSSEMANYLQTIYSNLISLNSKHDALNSRVMSDEVTRSFTRVSDMIGFSMCGQMGVFETSHILWDDYLGTLKVYHGVFPSFHNLTCRACLDRSFPFPNNAQSSASLNEDMFKALTNDMCSQENGITKCSGICAYSLQLINDIHWSGSPYSSMVKSFPVKFQLITGDDTIGTSDLLDPVVYSVPLRTPRSETGTLKCAYWDEDEAEWSHDGCTLHEETSGELTVKCGCNHLGEVVIIDRCPSGYYGINCDQVCPYGLYGEECSQDCVCSITGRCSPHDGTCDCSPGWTGTRCDIVCPIGTWGKGCQETCQCENDGLCDHVTGYCDCQSGWIGSHCNIECPNGFYGDNCANICSCRSDSECDFITGNCSCEPGYTGSTCHEPCRSGYYGNSCSEECQCNTNGTEECDHINGTCYCFDMWSGDLCEIPPYVPTPEPVPFPFWIPATAVPVGVVLALIVISVIILFCFLWKKKKQGKSRVMDISEMETGETRMRILGESDAKDESEEDELELTRATSFNTLIPSGKKLTDLFTESDDEQDFKEPEQIGVKRRWQIIQILPSAEPSETRMSNNTVEKTKNRCIKDTLTEKEKMKVESGIEVESIDTTDSDHNIQETPGEDKCQEIVYRKGVYLDVNAVLKDLRNGFIDSKQLEPDNLLFQFLNSDMPGDYIPIDSEEDTLLAKIEPNLLTPKTLYMESVNNSAVALELCVCGKFAELECTECRAKGYCSEQCQQDDWFTHASTCRIVSAHRRKTKKLKKKRKKLEKKLREIKRSGYTPRPDLCLCGKDAEYECSECGQQGYCSQRCQEEDWELHQLFCAGQQEISREDEQEQLLNVDTDQQEKM